MLKKRPKPPAEAQDTREDTAREIGRRLREARQARGENLDDVAEFLRIRPAYLAALEQGELGQIPGRPYVLGFLRSYGTYLGLDGEELVNTHKASINRVAAAPELNVREPIAESRRGTAVMVTASLLLAAAVYTSYYVIYHVDRGTVEPVAEASGDVARLATNTLRRSDAERAAGQTASTANPPAPPAPVAPARSSTPVTTPAAPAGEPAPQVASAPDAASALASESRAADAARSSTPTAANAAPASATELLAALESDRVAASRPMAATSGDPSGRLSLVALESSWIQIRSASRDYVRTRTLEPGEKFVVPNRGDLALWTGNAGGIEVMVDGRSEGPLGQPGEVIKALPLSPDQIKTHRAR